MKVTHLYSPKLETYLYYFWYKKSDGYWSQHDSYFYASSKHAHQAVEKYAEKYLSKQLKSEIKTVRVEYC